MITEPNLHIGDRTRTHDTAMVAYRIILNVLITLEEEQKFEECCYIRDEIQAPIEQFLLGVKDLKLDVEQAIYWTCKTYGEIVDIEDSTAAIMAEVIFSLDGSFVSFYVNDIEYEQLLIELKNKDQ